MSTSGGGRFSTDSAGFFSPTGQFTSPSPDRNRSASYRPSYSGGNDSMLMSSPVDHLQQTSDGHASISHNSIRRLSDSTNSQYNARVVTSGRSFSVSHIEPERRGSVPLGRASTDSSRAQEMLARIRARTNSVSSISSRLSEGAGGLSAHFEEPTINKPHPSTSVVTVSSQSTSKSKTVFRKSLINGMLVERIVSSTGEGCASALGIGLVSAFGPPQRIPVGSGWKTELTDEKPSGSCVLQLKQPLPVVETLTVTIQAQNHFEGFPEFVDVSSSGNSLHGYDAIVTHHALTPTPGQDFVVLHIPCSMVSRYLCFVFHGCSDGGRVQVIKRLAVHDQDMEETEEEYSDSEEEALEVANTHDPPPPMVESQGETVESTTRPSEPVRRVSTALLDGGQEGNAEEQNGLTLDDEAMAVRRAYHAQRSSVGSLSGGASMIPSDNYAPQEPRTTLSRSSIGSGSRGSLSNLPPPPPPSNALVESSAPDEGLARKMSISELNLMMLKKQQEETRRSSAVHVERSSIPENTEFEETGQDESAPAHEDERGRRGSAVSYRSFRQSASPPDAWEEPSPGPELQPQQMSGRDEDVLSPLDGNHSRPQHSHSIVDDSPMSPLEGVGQGDMSLADASRRRSSLTSNQSPGASHRSPSGSEARGSVLTRPRVSELASFTGSVSPRSPKTGPGRLSSILKDFSPDIFAILDENIDLVVELYERHADGAYSDYSRRMSLEGFLLMCRNYSLLVNRFGYPQAEGLFRNLAQRPFSSAPQMITLSQFCDCLLTLGSVNFPTAMPPVALKRLLVKCILPDIETDFDSDDYFCLEELFYDEILAFHRSHEDFFRSIFIHYCTCASKSGKGTKWELHTCSEAKVVMEIEPFRQFCFEFGVTDNVAIIENAFHRSSLCGYMRKEKRGITLPQLLEAFVLVSTEELGDDSLQLDSVVARVNYMYEKMWRSSGPKIIGRSPSDGTDERRRSLVGASGEGKRGSVNRRSMSPRRSSVSPGRMSIGSVGGHDSPASAVPKEQSPGPKLGLQDRRPSAINVGNGNPPKKSGIPVNSLLSPRAEISQPIVREEGFNVASNDMDSTAGDDWRKGSIRTPNGMARLAASHRNRTESEVVVEILPEDLPPPPPLPEPRIVEYVESTSADTTQDHRPVSIRPSVEEELTGVDSHFDRHNIIVRRETDRLESRSNPSASSAGDGNNSIAPGSRYKEPSLAAPAPKHNLTQREINLRLTAMRQGGYFSKYDYHDKKVRRRFVWVEESPRGLFLHWRQATKKLVPKKVKTLRLNALKFITYGPSTKTLKRNHDAIRYPWRCFSLVFADRTVDLEADNDSACECWIIGLQYYCQNNIRGNNRKLYTWVDLTFKRMRMKLEQQGITSRVSWSYLFAKFIRDSADTYDPNLARRGDEIPTHRRSTATRALAGRSVMAGTAHGNAILAASVTTDVAMLGSGTDSLVLPMPPDSVSAHMSRRFAPISQESSSSEMTKRDSAVHQRTESTGSRMRSRTTTSSNSDMLGPINAGRPRSTTYSNPLARGSFNTSIGQIY